MKTNLIFQGIYIKNFRSISDLKINFEEKGLKIICGPNNVGKTNFLRALDLYFSMDKEKFDPDIDISYHIRKGSRGGGDRTTITGLFVDTITKNNYKITLIYKSVKEEGNVLEINGQKNNTGITEEESRKILNSFKFIFVESSNINLPEIIREIFKEKALTKLDKKRSTQKNALEALNEFYNKSFEAIKSIETDITNEFKKFIGEKIFDTDINNWKLKVNFPEVNLLREAITNQIGFTLEDNNDYPLETKGSGIQKIILVSLISYVVNSIERKIIWGIDEPEAFLQPLLQKKLFRELKALSKKMNIVITTHSTFFIEIDNLSDTLFFYGKEEIVEYERKKGKKFIKTNTCLNTKKGFEKLELIKDHMGLEKNDSWEIYKTNIIVEGGTDQKYIQTMMKYFDLQYPKIIPVNGADNVIYELNFINEMSEKLPFKPSVLCILDHDDEGKKVFDKLKSKKEKNSYKHLNLEFQYIPRFDNSKTGSKLSWAIEDFIYPELIYKGVNSFLKKKKFNIIPEKGFKQRTESAYNEENILSFLKSKTKEKNSTKKTPEFSDEHFKKILCTEIIKEFNNDLISPEMVQKYPIVKTFLKKLSEFNN